MEAGVGAEGVEGNQGIGKRELTVAFFRSPLEPRDGLIMVAQSHTSPGQCRPRPFGADPSNVKLCVEFECTIHPVP